jgi:hypothetical protein
MKPASHSAAGHPRASGVAMGLAAALSLAGCVDPGADLAANDAAQHIHLARQPDVSLAGATVAFVSVDGAPSTVSASFLRDLSQQASAQEIVVVSDAKKARYLVRGYLSAYPTKDGAAIEYVWDVFTKDKLRTQRLSDYLEVKGQGDDAWAIAGDGALSSVAAKSADDLAAFLSNTPEAVAEAKPPAKAADLTPGGADMKALSYAPTE